MNASCPETAWAQTITEDCITSVSWQSNKWPTVVSLKRFHWRRVIWLCCPTPGRHRGHSQMLRVNKARYEAEGKLKITSCTSVTSTLGRKLAWCIINTICYKEDKRSHWQQPLSLLNPGLHWLVSKYNLNNPLTVLKLLYLLKSANAMRIKIQKKFQHNCKNVYEYRSLLAAGKTELTTLYFPTLF